MVYQVPPSKASLKQNRFPFQVPGSDKKWSLPLMQYLSAAISQRLGQAAAEAHTLQSDAKRIGALLRSGATLTKKDQALQAKIAESSARMKAVQESIFETYCPGLVDIVDDEQVEHLLAAWSEASQVSLGESQPSPQN